MSVHDRPRGFTLLELLTASAVGGVILFAALAAFDLQNTFSRNTERLLSAHATANLGLNMMARDLENAGLHFVGGGTDAGTPDWVAVVRPYDNLTTGISLRNDSAGTSFVVAATGASAGFIPGTDAFEVLLGSDTTVTDINRTGAKVTGVAGNSVTASLPVLKPAEAAAAGTGAGPLLSFTSLNVHCLARAVGFSQPGIFQVITIAPVNPDFSSGGAISPTCPSTGLQIQVLEKRHRFLVWQTAPPNIRTGLAMQKNADCNPYLLVGGTSCSPDLNNPVLVSEGVDDMQLTWRVPPWIPGVPATGWCEQNTTDPTCGFGNPTSLGGQIAANIYGAQIMLSSQGLEAATKPGLFAPGLLNHPAPGIPDGIERSVLQTMVSFRNGWVP